MMANQPSWMSGSRGPDGLEQIDFLGAGEEAQTGDAAGVAYGQTDRVDGFLLAVGVGWIAGQVDGVVQRDHDGVRGR